MDEDKKLFIFECERVRDVDSCANGKTYVTAFLTEECIEELFWYFARDRKKQLRALFFDELRATVEEKFPS
jgi:hypothetical protein